MLFCNDVKVREYNAGRPWQVYEYVNSLTAAFRASVRGNAVLSLLVDAANGASVTLLGGTMPFMYLLSQYVQSYFVC